MAKTPNKYIPVKRSSESKPSRSSAPVSFVDENANSDEIQNDDDEKVDERSDDDDVDVNKLLQEIQKRQAKKASLVSTAFENQKKTLYTNARQKAKDMNRDGMVYLENIKPSLLSMKENETPYDRHLEEFGALWNAQDSATSLLFGLYPPIIDELFVKRSQTIDDASRMLKLNPARRQKALNHFLHNAQNQIEQSHQNQMAATNASKLIKHYKALLLS